MKPPMPAPSMTQIGETPKAQMSMAAITGIQML